MSESKVLIGLYIVHTWASVLKKYEGMNPEQCKDAEKYIDNAISLIKDQKKEIESLKEQVKEKEAKCGMMTFLSAQRQSAKGKLAAEIR